MSREEILAPALEELRACSFRRCGRRELLKSGVLKEARATFSVTPGLDRFRPQQRTRRRDCYLAGDWTRDGVALDDGRRRRSGRLAAGAVRRHPHPLPDARPAAWWPDAAAEPDK